ncbi:MAG: flagellar biosynthetic protein FliQ [Polyangiales bacterium]
MLDPVAPFALAREALVLATALSLPIVAAAALVGIIVGALQSATSLQDAALAHLPKLVVVVVATALTAPWMARTLAAFAARAFAGVG